MKELLRPSLVIILSVFIVFHSAFADTQKKELLSTKRKNLSSLIVSIDYIESEIKLAQRILASGESLGREDVIKLRIEKLSRKLAGLNESFDLLATGVSYKTSPANLQSGFDWNDELQKLIGPLITELQELTSRPREIEKLKSDIAFYEEHIRLADTAIENLNRLLEISKKSGALRERLSKSIEEWANRKNEWEALNNIGVEYLKQQRGDKSISKSIQDIPKVFFKSHGRNMLVALLVFFLSSLGMFKLYGVIKKYNPFRLQKRSFYGRIFDLGYFFIAIMFSLLSMLASLYLFNDWVLLSVIIIIIFGILWASKQAFPVIWLQVKLILNLGPVREGEVIVYKGLLYKVVSLNFHTTLSNPVIEGGLIKVPINDILELRSRPVIDEEPWFPSAKGDWVILSDNRHGKVITQTPETVRLKFLGGMETSYNTGDYLGHSPMNLSSGFRLSIGFGLDYLYQTEITSTIPAILEKGVIEGLIDAGFAEKMSSVRVEFKAAAASSLDLEVIANFNKTAGRHYSKLERVIQKACVDVCNKQNWIIPFMQMTVHMAESE